MRHMDSHRERLVRLAAHAREERGLERQIDLIKATGLSKSTVHRFEQGGAVSETALRKISRVIGWTSESGQDVLAGGEPTIMPDTSQAVAGPTDGWVQGISSQPDLVAVLEHVVFDLVVTVAPDTPAAEVKALQARALESFKKHGIRPSRRRLQTHTDDDPES